MFIKVKAVFLLSKTPLPAYNYAVLKAGHSALPSLHTQFFFLLLSSPTSYALMCNSSIMFIHLPLFFVLWKLSKVFLRYTLLLSQVHVIPSQFVSCFISCNRITHSPMPDIILMLFHPLFHHELSSLYKLHNTPYN